MYSPACEKTDGELAAGEGKAAGKRALTTRELDEVLDPVDERQGAVGVPLPNVAGLEPAVDEGLSVLLVSLVIALGDTATSKEDFSLGRVVGVEVASVGVVQELNLDGGDGDSNAFGSPELGHEDRS
jgi:hypothetical protein